MSAAAAAAVVGLLVAAAARLAAGPAPVRLLVSSGRLPHRWVRGRRGAAAALAGGVAALTVPLEGASLAVAVIALLTVIGSALTWRRGREQARCQERRAQVVEVSEALVGELRSGQPVVEALERCSRTWSPLLPVAAAARLGADVPAALRRSAALPGAEGLERLASAWQVSQRTGSPLSQVVDQVAVSARAELAATRLVRAELASAQATARLVALLPVATLTMSAGVGGHPWAFLLGHPVGLACLATGIGLVFAGLWWIDRIAASVARS